MVDDHVVRIAGDIDGVDLAARDVARARAYEAHDHVVRRDADFTAAEADAVAGSGLPGDGQEMRAP